MLSDYLKEIINPNASTDTSEILSKECLDKIKQHYDHNMYITNNTIIVNDTSEENCLLGCYYPSIIKIDGIVFMHVYQAFVYFKSKLKNQKINDTFFIEELNQIDQNLGTISKEDYTKILLKINYYKFLQNDLCRNFLIKTKNFYIECEDKILANILMFLRQFFIFIK